MLPRRDRMLLWGFALLVVAWMVAQAITGTETGLLYLAPALVLALPLVGGHYVGEDQLVAAAAGGGKVARAPERVAATHTFVRVMQRGGRLVACSLAKRPPPAPLLAST
jgi:hypothetical protein